MPVRFSRDGGLLARLGPQPGTLLIREVATGRTWTAERTISTWERLDLAFSPDGRTLVSGGLKTILWDTVEIHWTVEAPSYQLQSRTNLRAGDWQNEGAPTDASSATVQMDSGR